MAIYSDNLYPPKPNIRHVLEIFSSTAAWAPSAPSWFRGKTERWFPLHALPPVTLQQEVFHLGHLKDGTPVDLHVVIDATNAAIPPFIRVFVPFALGVLAILHDTVLPYYSANGNPVEAIITDSHATFSSSLYTEYLTRNGIIHQRLPLGSRAEAAMEAVFAILLRRARASSPTSYDVLAPPAPRAR